MIDITFIISTRISVSVWSNEFAVNTKYTNCMQMKVSMFVVID